MSLFNWFSGKSRSDASAPEANRSEGAAEAAARAPVPEGSRTRRHARRDQLFNAIRESMTRSGVLSARYKFKVLSLDQVGNEFLVMMDLSAEYEGTLEQLPAMEAAIIRHAKARLDIIVPTVYWRVDAARTPAPAAAPISRPAVLSTSSGSSPAPLGVLSGPVPLGTRAVAAPMVFPGPTRTAQQQLPVMPKAPSAITDLEVAAFQQALRAASAKAPETIKETNARSGGMIRPRSYTLLTGFEDTEMPDGNNGAGLSKTQYGDLK